MVNQDRGIVAQPGGRDVLDTINRVEMVSHGGFPFLSVQWSFALPRFEHGVGLLICPIRTLCVFM